MTTVAELMPGDSIFLGIFITKSVHPIWPHLRLVVWYLPHEDRYTFDALSPLQEVGEVERGNNQANLRLALKLDGPIL